MAVATVKPRWAQRRDAFAADSRGEDGTQHLITAPVSRPDFVTRYNQGRPEWRKTIRGVDAMQRLNAMQAFRARTSLSPQGQQQAAPVAPHGELRMGADGRVWKYDAMQKRGVPAVQDAAEPEVKLLGSPTQDLATQQFENRKRLLMAGGISAPEADRAAFDEFQGGSQFTGPRNVKPATAKPSSLAHLSAAMKRKPRVLN